MKAQFMKDDDGKIWFHHAKHVIVRKIITEPGWILTIDLDFMAEKTQQNSASKDGREQPESDSQGGNKMTQKMEGMIGNYYKNMVEQNNLYPSTDTSVDSENDRAIQKLRPKSALNFVRYLQKHGDEHPNPQKRRKVSMKPVKQNKMVLYDDVNISRKQTLKNMHSEKILKKNFINQKARDYKEEPVDLQDFFPRNYM